MTAMPTTSVNTPLGRVSFTETGQGPPLVILHSLLTDSRSFDRVIPHLSGRIITLDLPGFGTTDPAPASIDAFADMMAAAVLEICGDEVSPTVMGNGLGAFVALGMAVRHPELLGRLVLVGCGAAIPEAGRPAFSTMIELVESGGMAALTPVALRRIFTEDYLEAHPEEAEERAAVMATTDPKAFVAACRALLGMDFTASAPGVPNSTLIVVGEDDRATRPEMAIRLNDLMPNATLVTLSGVAHAPQLQDPPGFVDAISQFLEGE
jgi:3-oxoadipate enol-lactonase